METENKNVRPFGLRDKIGYMFGDFGNDFTFIFASSFLMVFYTKVLGISGGMVGTLFLVARFVDAFTDVTMGRIVDSFKPGKDGRFRCWIRRMCAPVAIAGRGSHVVKNCLYVCDVLVMGQYFLHLHQYSLWLDGFRDHGRP